MGTTYEAAGVNINAGNETVGKIGKLVKKTFNKNVLSGIGHFGAFYQPDFAEYKEPVLVSSVDGVGTKLKVAIMMNQHNTVGQDLVNHCVDDIAVCGAKPLYFMDYMAFGKLDPNVAEQIVSGFAKACYKNNMALIGGETAEMPGIYNKTDYDLSGTIVGVVDKAKIIDGSKVDKGDILIGFKSNGLHTNGYSLARKVLLSKFNLDDKPDGLEYTVGKELLRIHKSYLGLISLLKEKIDIHAFSHITGGGMIGNTIRVVPENLSIKINWDAWELPPIFQLIRESGKISDDEMRKVFNIGIGLVAIVAAKDVDMLLKTSSEYGEKGIIIGEIM